MGKIKLFIRCVASSFRADWVLYIFITLGMVVSTTMLFFFEQFYFLESDQLRSNVYEHNRVTFLFSDTNQFAELSDFIGNSGLATDLLFRCSRESDLGTNEIASMSGSHTYSSDRILAGTFRAKEGEFIASERFRQRVYQKMKTQIRIGSQIQLNTPLVCSGIVLTNDFDILVDFKTFLSIDAANLFTMTYIFGSNTEIQQVDLLNQQIIERFRPISTIRPEQTSSFSLWKLMFALGPNLLILGVGIINYFFIYAFLLKRRLYPYSIFKLCGLTNRATAGCLLGEMLVLFTLSFGLGISIYLLLAAWIAPGGFSHFGLTLASSYPLLLLINLVQFAIISRGLVFKSCVDMYRESEAQ